MKLKTIFGLMLITFMLLEGFAVIHLSPRPQPDSVTFAVIGDFGYYDDDEPDNPLNVATLVKGWSPDFIITTGDNSYPQGLTTNFHQNIGRLYHEFILLSPEFYRPEYGAQPAENKFFPTMGNHDWDGTFDGVRGRPYIKYFSSLPDNEFGHKRFYDFVRGPVHFFALSSDSEEPGGIAENSVQGEWFKRRVAASTARWRIAYFHHPPYTSMRSGLGGGHGPTEEMRWKFLKSKVHAVLTGHNHNYERIMLDCLPYITIGCSGKLPFYKFRSGQVAEGSVVRYDENHGALKVIATDDAINFEFLIRGNISIDRHEIKSSYDRPPDAPINFKVRRVSRTQVHITWQAKSCDEAGFKIEQSTDGRNFAEIATVDYNERSYSVTGLNPSTEYFYRAIAFNNAGRSDYSNIDSFNPAVFTPTVRQPARRSRRGRATRRRSAP